MRPVLMGALDVKQQENNCQRQKKCPVQAKQIMQWGAEGVIVGSALVKALGDAASPQEGLKAMETLAKSIREAI
jgi:hypothetical protein